MPKAAHFELFNSDGMTAIAAAIASNAILFKVVIAIIALIAGGFFAIVVIEGVDHQLTIFIADLKRFPHIGRAGEDLRSELVEAEAASNSLEHLREDDVVGVRFQTPFA